MKARTKFKREIQEVLKLLKPPPKINVAEWADANRYIARGTSAEAGKFSTDRLPYQREVMAAITDRACGEIIMQWGAQKIARSPGLSPGQTFSA